MIYLYYGKIGDGKTYHVLKNDILPALRKGRKVYTNIDGLNVRSLALYLDMSPDQVCIVHHKEHSFYRENLVCGGEQENWESSVIEANSLIVIDEAQKIWDARQFKDTKKEFLNFLEYHRHFGFDLVFITQNPKRLESAIVRLSNEAYQVKNLKVLGSLFSSRYVIHIRQTAYDRDIIATVRGSFKKELFSLYKSYRSSGKFSKESKGALSNGIFLLIPLLVAFALTLFITRGGFSFSSKKSDVKPKAAYKASPGDFIYEERKTDDKSISQVSSVSGNSGPVQGSMEVPEAKVSLDLSRYSDVKRDCRYLSLSAVTITDESGSVDLQVNRESFLCDDRIVYFRNGKLDYIKNNGNAGADGSRHGPAEL